MEKQIILSEIRALEGNGMQIRARVNDYSISKELSGINGKFKEQIPREVWERAIDKDKDNINVYINHLPYINVVKGLELRAEEDAVYLYATLKEDAEKVYEGIKQGIINACSFGFRCLKSTWSGALRKVEDMELLEVSLLDVEPAYFGTEIEARALEIPKAKWQIDLELKQKQLDLYKLI